MRNLHSRISGESISLSGLYFMAYASSAAWYPLLNVYLKEHELSGFEIGIVSSVIPMVMLVGQPFWGLGADRWGRRRTLLLTMFLSSVLVTGFVWCEGFWLFLAWNTIFALLFNPVQPLIDSYALDYVEAHPRSSYGRFRMWGAIGWAVTTPIVGHLTTGRDLGLIFPVAAVLMLVGWLVGVQSKGRESGRTGLELSWEYVGPVVKNGRLLLFLVLAFMFAVGTASVWTFYSVYLSEIGASRQLIGIAFGIQGFSELPFFFFSRAILDRCGIERTLTFAFLLMAGRVFFYSWTYIPALAVAVDVVHGMTWSLFLVASVEYVNMLVPPKLRATGQSLFWAVYFGAGAIIGNTWAGFLYDRMHIHGMFGVNAWIILTAAILAVTLFNKSHFRVEARKL